MSASIRNVELHRASGGYGFTLSSQGPCVLSCILASSPAHKAGLKPGDQILYVNGSSVERHPHEQVVKLIARSPDGRVNLGVRNRVVAETKPATAALQSHETADDVAVNNAIINRVDKVVEELRSGQLLVNTPVAIRRSLSSTTDGVTSISEDDIASDEELKASFNENVFIDSPSDSVFSEQHFFDNNSRRSSEAEITPTKLNRELYPALTPTKSAPDMCTDTRTEPDYKAVVGYLGSIELPSNSSLQNASLNAIRGCVRRLRAQQKVHLMFVLEVSVVGVLLVDSSGNIVVTYPVRSLAFTGLCSDDNKVFGIVTRKSADANRPSSWHSSKGMVDSQSTVNCSCHVFSVDSDLVPHEVHKTTAEKFHVKCTEGSGDSLCREFQNTALPILNAISGLFKERAASEPYLDEMRPRSRSIPSAPYSVDQSVKSKSSCGDQYTCSFDGNLNAIAVNKNVSRSKPNIRVKISDSIEDSFIHERSMSDPALYDEPFRRRSVQIQRVSPLLSRKESYGSSYDNLKENSNDGKLIEKDNYKRAVTSSQQAKVSTPAIDVLACNTNGHVVSTTSSPESLGDSLMSQSSSHSYQSEMSHKDAYDKTFDIMELENCLSVESLDHAGNGPGKPMDHLSPSRTSSTQSLHSVNSMSNETVEGRVSRWALGFDKLMDDQAGLHCFEEFLKKEFSEENIVFWIACEEFRSISDPKKLKSAASTIFETHLSPNALMPVNIDSSAVKVAEEHLLNPTNHMYRVPQQQVYTLMKFDSYPRFLKSDLYRQCLMCEAEGVALPYEEPEPEEKVKKFRFTKKHSGRGLGRRSSSKKSSSSMEESKTPGEKMRALLPWKGKYARKGSRPFDSQPSSARSSISSLSDSGQNMSRSTESLEGKKENDSMHFCRIVLPDQSSTIVSARHGQTLAEALTRLCERRHMSLAAMGVYLGASNKPAQPKDLDIDMSHLSNQEVTLEHRSLFRLELPGGQILGIKARPEQNVRSCFEPILKRNKIDYNDVILHVADCKVPLDSGVPVASIEHQDVIAEMKEDTRVTGKPPISTGPRRSGRRGSGWDDSMFNDIVQGKKQSLGDGYFDDTGVWVSGLKPFRSQESLGDSFGKSFLRGPGLFSRKRKEMEHEKAVVIRSGPPPKNTEVKEFIDLLSRAQGKRLDDQRGSLNRDAFELPDFLRLPNKGEGISSAEADEGVASHNPSRPVVRKTISSPAVMATDQRQFLNELTSRLTNRSEQNPPTITENEDQVDAQHSTASPRNTSNYSPWERRRVSEHSRIHVVRPRDVTDGKLFRVEAVTPVRFKSDGRFSYRGFMSPQLIHSESDPNIVPPYDHHQPLTVNSIRGLYTSTGNIRMSTEEGRERTVVPSKFHSHNKYRNRNFSAPSFGTSRTDPYVYESSSDGVQSISEKYRSSGKIRDISSIARETRSRGPYYLPEVEVDQAEVHVPSGTSKTPRYRPTLPDRKPRPRPITDQSSVIAGLERDRARSESESSTGDPPMPNALSPTPSGLSSTTGSPLPQFPSPPDDSADLGVADFPPPTPLISGRSTGEKAQHRRVTSLQADSLTPELSINKTITPTSGNDRTLTSDTPDDATPVASKKHSINDVTTRLNSRLHEGERGELGKSMSKLDPYVTYETDDLRITFV
ncbi:regulator of G-protein signaling 12 isoform X2 [Nematostella vectensis]|uniref:regulator of G-protein signaling 12 isoform X2 n=1 Tax=Nematostella vectensis TaxID=45351 RepID=UPI0020771CBF|nr:regulator of G-protein signaling 12 isoform X2 [Nematostella vectensis]